MFEEYLDDDTPIGQIIKTIQIVNEGIQKQDDEETAPEEEDYIPRPRRKKKARTASSNDTAGPAKKIA